MDLKLINSGKKGELFLDGRLDSATALQLEPVVMRTAEKFETLVLNLQNLEYTASSGLRIIRSLQIAMNQKGGDLIIKNPRPAVMEVFELTGFSGFLKIVKD